jgi:hypothetical protein
MQLVIIFSDQKADKLTSEDIVQETITVTIPKLQHAKPDITEKDLNECEDLIRRFTHLDSLETKRDVYRYFANYAQKCKRTDHKEGWQYIASSYLKRDRDFGDMYLNLDNHNRLLILRAWGIYSEQHYTTLAEYQYRIDADELEASFRPAPIPMQIIENMLMFFCNHKIQYSVCTGVNFTHIPHDKKCFGNTRNWAEHLIKYKEICHYYPADYTNAFRSILSHYTIRV